MTEKIQETEIKKTRLRLSERLKLVASFVPEGSRIADIGTDHGYVPIYLAEIGKIKIAMIILNDLPAFYVFIHPLLCL